MKKIILASAALAFLAIPASAYELECNTAVQNWANGSQTTCPFDGGGDAPAAQNTGSNDSHCGPKNVNGKPRKRVHNS